MNPKALTKTILLDHTPDHVHIGFLRPCQVASSAVFNGGMVRADHIVNLRVNRHWDENAGCLETPETTLQKYCSESGWHGTAVGMMTAASMESLRIARYEDQGVHIMALATAGLSNPRRAGDRAEERLMDSFPHEIGTINIVVMTSAMMTESAMIEALMIATEAKAAALQDLGVKSPVSNLIATGTGTDALAIAAGEGPVKIRYCGKHVLFGEMLARLVIEVVTSSLSWDLARQHP